MERATVPIGLHVLQISKSNTHDVTLVDVSRKLTGWYKCEVSASSPSYHTLIEKARMEVVGKCTSIALSIRNVHLFLMFLFVLRSDHREHALRVGIVRRRAGTEMSRLFRYSIPKR